MNNKALRHRTQSSSRQRDLTEEELEFLQRYYRTRGPDFCAAQLNMARNTLRYKLQLWRENHGEIEFIEPIPQGKKPRRLFGGPIPKPYNSCHHWSGFPERGNSQPAAGGRRIA